MVKRTRLRKAESMLKKGTRLRHEIRKELMGYSDRQLMNLVKTPNATLAVDPIISTYAKLAGAEIEKRKMLRARFGEAPLVKPSKVLGILDKIENSGKVYFRFLKKGFTGELFGKDFEKRFDRITDDLIDKLDEYRKRGAKAEDRWAGFAKAHGLLKKTETDFIREGWDVEARFRHTVNPSLLKAQVARQRKLGRKSFIIPTKADGKMYYSLMVRG